MMVRHSVPYKRLKRVEEVFWDQIYGEPIRDGIKQVSSLVSFPVLRFIQLHVGIQQ